MRHHRTTVVYNSTLSAGQGKKAIERVTVLSGSAPASAIEDAESRGGATGSRDVVVRAEGVGKQYALAVGDQARSADTLRDAIAGSLRRMGRAPSCRAEPFWALRNVDFSICRGEAVGFIGRNGAGKSTLLKILSRITEPTEGRVTIRGRVASLLEVGTGFHGELSGRENIFLNGAILGMARTEIACKFDEIVAFAEIEKFIDSPVKRYSSGMYMRLAFAVAAHLEPEILIVDEVLAVGDAEFQKKCIGKMNEVTGAGRTVLFVSHSLSAVAALCRRVLVFDHGRLTADTAVDAGIASYLRSLRVPQEEDDASIFAPVAPSLDPAVRLLSANLSMDDGSPTNQFRQDDAVVLRMVVEIDRSTAIRVGMQLQSHDGIILLTSYSDDHREHAPHLAVGVHAFTCCIPPHFLNSGAFSLTLGAQDGGTRFFFLHEQALNFDVLELGGLKLHGRDRRLGFLRVALAWEDTD